MIKNVLHMYKKPIIIALFQWFLTTILQVDRLFFIYQSETRNMLIIKGAYLLFLIVTWCYIFFASGEIKAGNDLYCRGASVFVTYFVMEMLLFLILMPGTWGWDDLVILGVTRSYESLGAWQHILTVIFEDVFLQMFPFPAGVIFFRCAIAALCVAFSVTKLEETFFLKQLKCKSMGMAVKLLPFFLPPIIMYLYSGYRMGLYVFLEVTMLVMLLCSAYGGKKWSWPYCILFVFLCVVVSAWRTESFSYILFSPLLLISLGKSVLPDRKKVFCVVFLAAGFLGMNAWQNKELGNDNYKVMSLMRQCAVLARAANYDRDEEELYLIDKVVSLEEIQNNPEMNGEELYWEGAVRDGYTEEEYGNFVKAIARLSLKYPKKLLEERWVLFIWAMGDNTVTNVEKTAPLLDEDTTNVFAKEAQNQGYCIWSAPFRNLRKDFVYFLGCCRRDGTAVKTMQKLVWNVWIPFMPYRRNAADGPLIFRALEERGEKVGKVIGQV